MHAIKLGLERLQANYQTWQIRWLMIFGEPAKAQAKPARLEAIDARHPPGCRAKRPQGNPHPARECADALADSLRRPG